MSSLYFRRPMLLPRGSWLVPRGTRLPALTAPVSSHPTLASSPAFSQHKAPLSTAASDKDSFDYIVVGAGSAGCVLGNRLSRDANNRVLVLEAGGQDSYPWIHVPAGYLYTMKHPRTSWAHTHPRFTPSLHTLITHPHYTPSLHILTTHEILGTAHLLCTPQIHQNTHTYTHRNIHTRTITHRNTHTHMHTYKPYALYKLCTLRTYHTSDTHMHTHTHTRTRARTHTRTYAHTHINTNSHTHTGARARRHTHTDTHITRPGLPHDAAAGSERAGDLLPTGPGAGGVLLHQRDDLPAWAAARL